MSGHECAQSPVAGLNAVRHRRAMEWAFFEQAQAVVRAHMSAVAWLAACCLQAV